jgi:metal-sulfur cluster biosynthetic enzyme
MSDTEALREAIIEKLTTIIDPETGADVIRMRLVEELVVESGGRVSYQFRPSSPLCPIAIPLAQSIKEGIASVPGVTEQTIMVSNYVQAALLTELINEI